MSSMFKKKGGLAFKPKAPALRRPAAATTATPPASLPAAKASARTAPAPLQVADDSTATAPDVPVTAIVATSGVPADNIDNAPSTQRPPSPADKDAVPLPPPPQPVAATRTRRSSQVAGASAVPRVAVVTPISPPSSQRDAHVVATKTPAQHKATVSVTASQEVPATTVSASAIPTPSTMQTKTRSRRSAAAATAVGTLEQPGSAGGELTQSGQGTGAGGRAARNLRQIEGAATEHGSSSVEAGPVGQNKEPVSRRTRRGGSMTRSRPVAEELSVQPISKANEASGALVEQTTTAIGRTSTDTGHPSGVAVAPPQDTAAPVAPTGRRGRSKASRVVSETATAAASAVVPPEDQSPANDTATAATAPKKGKHTRRQPAGRAAATVMVIEDDQMSSGVPPPQRRQRASRKRSADAAAVEGSVGADGIAMETEATTETAIPTPTPITPASASAPAPAPKRSRRDRSVTPEDAETRTVDHRELKMEDLTKDLRIGKKFSRHDELVDRLREKRRRYRRERLLSKKQQQQQQQQDGRSPATNNDSRDGSVLDGETSESGTRAPSLSQAPDAASTEGVDGVADAASGGGGGGGGASSSSTASKLNVGAAAPPAVTGPRFEIVDGAIVVNQASLMHDRHAAAAAAAGELEEVEENDFTRQTTSNTYLKPGKLRGPNAWTVAETELFYRALSMFGTSFDLICRWFPGKSRRHIKMKFNREDKLHADRITQALVGQHKVAIDVDEYVARTGQTLHATEALAAEYARRQAEHDAEQQRIVDEQAEALRKKREALFGKRRAAPAADGNDNDNDGGDGDDGGGRSGAGGVDGVDGGGNEDEIDETDMPVGGKGRGGRRTRRGVGRNGGRTGGASRQPVAAGFGA
ncbi:transcription factor tfiiib [Niveomyces insectorum RCEF 264]|uniref:Transcription factor tfiiib n=1 Tax=Niveomyces insectorum RCEF 264 TaxID=1081102 RepID=A0A162K6S7_9HYPO|nr:transcription factor tfiiib [Niveomyces insectorum RCEF 264]